MNSEVPEWVRVVAAVLTPAIALGVARAAGASWTLALIAAGAFAAAGLISLVREHRHSRAWKWLAQYCGLFGSVTIFSAFGSVSQNDRSTLLAIAVISLVLPTGSVALDLLSDRRNRSRSTA